ncbi:MAG: N-acetylglutaminylglutamine synthetase [Myxococcota bacterium]
MAAERTEEEGKPRRAPVPSGWRPAVDRMPASARNVVVDCGWGRLIFGHTFESNEALAKALCEEAPGRRDIAMYLTDPHVVISLAPQELFLDPSHTYRLYFERYSPVDVKTPGFRVRDLESREDAEQANRIWLQRHMVATDPQFMLEQRSSTVLTHLVAEDLQSGDIRGVVIGCDHKEAFGDPDNGCSLWALAVDPQSEHPGVGISLVQALIEHYAKRGRAFLDLSVMHDNEEAISLYEKLGFQRIAVFCVKRKNPINEPLFIAPPPEEELNPYAEIIIREARRRGIVVEVLDEEDAYFALSFGGRTIVCRESLSELTSAIAMSRCQDKRVTRRVLSRAGLSLPAQQRAGDDVQNEAFLAEHGRVVVKPTAGEQGAGVSVDIRTPEGVREAVARAGAADVILEQMVDGQDLRIIVIDFRVVAAAVRRPPQIIGNGKDSVRRLIEKQSRRRAAATGGESHIPVDDETRRCLSDAGRTLDDVPAEGEVITVRKTANLHTGGTIHDVTDRLHPRLRQAAEEAALALNIPVVGLDFIVPDPQQPDYWIIEANERPGLANHDPAPTAERFIDLLFPQTASPAPRSP